MDIVQLLTPDRAIFALRVADKTQLLQELARRASEYVNIPQKTILDGLLNSAKSWARRGSVKASPCRMPASRASTPCSACS